MTTPLTSQTAIETIQQTPVYQSVLGGATDLQSKAITEGNIVSPSSGVLTTIVREKVLAAITGGSLVGLRTSLGEDDTPVLVGLRSGGKEVPVSGMSDGARDALYLSLRIASLERYAETRECPPLVLDDVLVHFDDDRAGAVLEVLASLSRKMQVLFFTHHARLVELAGRCVPAGRLAVLDLARRG